MNLLGNETGCKSGNSKNRKTASPAAAWCCVFLPIALPHFGVIVESGTNYLRPYYAQNKELEEYKVR